MKNLSDEIIGFDKMSVIYFFAKCGCICFLFFVFQFASAKNMACEYSKVIDKSEGSHVFITKTFVVGDNITDEEVVRQWRDYLLSNRAQGAESNEYDGRYCFNVDNINKQNEMLSLRNVTALYWEPVLSKKFERKENAQPKNDDEKLESNSKNWIVHYGKNNKSCLRAGMSSDGYVTYTNVCKLPVEFGYCNAYGKDGHDGTVCKPSDSEFSRTGVNFITQSGGLYPGETHKLAYRYENGQAVFVVACPQVKGGSFPLIESFDSKSITPRSKFSSACWSFVYKKK